MAMTGRYGIGRCPLRKIDGQEMHLPAQRAQLGLGRAAKLFLPIDDQDPRSRLDESGRHALGDPARAAGYDRRLAFQCRHVLLQSVLFM